MNRQDRREAIYTLSVLQHSLAMKFDGKMETDAGNAAITNAIAGLDAALKELGRGMTTTEKRAAQNQVQYKTLQVVTRAAHPHPDGDQVVISVDDLNALFYHGREECVLCEKTDAQAKRCKVHRLFLKNGLGGVCKRE